MNVFKIVGALLVLFLVAGSCAKDNYDSPGSVFTGQFTYKGQPLPWNGNNDDANILQLYQHGFGKSGGAINVRTTDEGQFNALLFDGEYRVIPRNIIYPFVWDNWPRKSGGSLDTLSVAINGPTHLDIPVTPYFEITDVSYAVEGTNLAATFRISQVIGGAAVKNAYCYLGTTQLVNKSTQVSQQVAVTDISQPITIRIPISRYRTAYINNSRPYGFLRVALETDVSTEYLWSPVAKVEGLPVEFKEVTEEYMKNYKQPFTIQQWFDGRRGKVQDWLVTASLEPTMFDGWSDRLFMGAENWCGGNGLSGAAWQTTQLPAGKYVFTGRRGWNAGDLNGGLDRAFLVVSRTSQLEVEGANLIARADLASPGNSQSLSVDFELTEPTQVSLGYAVNFRPNECNAVSFISFTILKVE
ncbi:MAG: DUF3823 domain-containing protein [Candidatus Pseudobacter hemicellulosilyticus]|uniref:DUF3823 domain-containing protein n=1 Tax=Candidatus Pseudobacter hemicellulosilyticus TaxID=3121375 RepID=A0AAJ6BJC6_9BACT|nr:MAG: DUF3823 domain-containing protein [Pseudobacter sp.]